MTDNFTKQERDTIRNAGSELNYLCNSSSKVYVGYINNANEVTMKLADITPEQRAKAIYAYFGWQQGGTVHQLSDATGLSVSDILRSEQVTDNPPLGSYHSEGFSAVRTCDKVYRVMHLAPKYNGNLEYWQGVMVGYNISDSAPSGVHNNE